MGELVRFIWRGALGGAIVPLLLFTYFWILPYGPTMILYLVSGILFLIIPGGLVGAVLWLLCDQVSPNIGWLRRLVIGSATGLTIVFLWVLWEYLGSRSSTEVDALQVIEWTLIYGILVGAPAGLLTPPAIRPDEDSRPYDDVESFKEWRPPACRQQ